MTSVQILVPTSITNSITSQAGLSCSFIFSSTIPGAPSILTTIVSSSELYLTITPPSNTGGSPIQSYNIYSNVNNPSSSTLTLFGNSTNLSYYNFSSLRAATTYTFAVSAINSIGQGPQSASIQATTNAGVPLAPLVSATFVSTTQTDLVITNTYNGGSNITGYNVYLDGALYSSPVPSGNGTSCQVVAAALRFGRTHTYAVSSLNVYGESLQTPLSVPNPPVVSVTVTSASSVNLVITPPSFNGGFVVGAYRIYLDGSSYTVFDAVLNGITTTSISVTTGGTHTFSASAMNYVGEGSQSSSVSATLSSSNIGVVITGTDSGLSGTSIVPKGTPGKTL